MSESLDTVGIELMDLNNTSANAEGKSIKDLTRKMKRLDEAAYREFFALYYKRLFSYLMTISHGGRGEIEDSLQLSFQKITKHIKVFETEHAFWNWIRTIAKNTLTDLYRKEQSRKRCHSAAESETIAKRNGDLIANNRIHLLEQCIDELPHDEKQFIEKKYLSGLSYREIADETEMTAKAVESKLGRIRKKLRELIGTKEKDG